METNPLIVWNKVVKRHIATRTNEELAIGYLRFEALRKLSPLQYAELLKRNLAGELFDDMVDELIIKNENP